MLKLLCLAVLVALVQANEIVFKDCGHHEVTKVDVSNCSGDQCVIHKGADLQIALEADFVSNQDTKKVELKIVARIMGGLEIPVPGVESDGCNHVKCPLVKGEKYAFMYKLAIPKLLPNIKAVIVAQLIGDSGVLACINVNGEVQD